MKQNIQNLTIIGGGIMGLFTAYYASSFVKKITIIDKSTIPNKQAASFNFTRSIRNDYLDAEYSQLAYEAQDLWKDLEPKVKKQFLFRAGCLNLAKKSITPNINNTYAMTSLSVLKSLSFANEYFNKNTLIERFPQFTADLGCLDKEAGFLYLPVITEFIINELKKRNVTFRENIQIESIQEDNNLMTIRTNQGKIQTKKIVITAALGTNTVLKTIKDNSLQFPLYADKPQECKYYYIPEDQQQLFTPDRFPVFAYLDVGIYGHPIFDEKKSCIKIGYYNPPDVEKKENKKIRCIADFVNECLPMIKDFKNEPVIDADQCYYDMVKDDNFILGKLPNYKNIYVGCGWRGTGYKFAPLIGKILSQLSVQGRTVYSINRFSPERFLYEK